MKKKGLGHINRKLPRREATNIRSIRAQNVCALPTLVGTAFILAYIFSWRYLLKGIRSHNRDPKKTRFFCPFSTKPNLRWRIFCPSHLFPANLPSLYSHLHWALLTAELEYYT